MSCNLFEKFKKPLSKILFYSIVLVALVFGVLYLMENKQKEAPAGVAPSYVVPQRNIESNIQNYDLRKDIDPIFNKVHDELSVAYYNKKPFRNYGILTKEQFDNLHALIFLIRDVKFKEENLKLPTQNQIPEKDYNDILDDKGKVVGKKSEEAAKKIQELNAEGYNLTIPFIDNSFSYGNYGLRKKWQFRGHLSKIHTNRFKRFC